MKIIRYPNPTVPNTIQSTTSDSISYGDTTFDLSDVTGFSVNDFILIEENGNEKNEIVKITNITSDTLTITPAITLPHDQSITVTKIDYDKYKITRSLTSTGVFDTVIEENIKFDNPYNRIEYYANGETDSDNAYYRIYYVNSELVTEDLQTTLYKEETGSYITMTRWRNLMNISSTDLSDAELSSALNEGVEYIRDCLFNLQKLNSQGSDNSFTIHTSNNQPFGDWFALGELDESQIIVYEYDRTSKTKTYINHLIAKVVGDEITRIFFKEDVPRNSRRLFFDFPTTFKKQRDIVSTFAEINKLIANNVILTNTTNNNVRTGILSWTAGGETVTKNPESVTAAIESNQKRVDYLVNKILTKVYIKKTKLRSRYSSLDRRYRNGAADMAPSYRQGYDLNYGNGSVFPFNRG